MSSFNFYENPSLTTQVTSETFRQASDLSLGSQDIVVYFGSPDPSMMAQNGVSPGTSPVTLAVLHTGTPGQPDNVFSLGLSSGALDANVQTLDLGTTIMGGAGNAAVIYVRCDITAGTHSTGSYPPSGSTLYLGFPDGIYEDVA